MNAQLNVAFLLGQNNLSSNDELVRFWETGSEERDKFAQTLHEKLTDHEIRLVLDSIEVMKKRRRIGKVALQYSRYHTLSLIAAGEHVGSVVPTDLIVLLEELNIKDEVSSILQAQRVCDLATLFNLPRLELAKLPVRMIPLKKLLRVYDDHHGSSGMLAPAPAVNPKDTVRREAPDDALLDTPVWKYLNLESLPRERVERFFYKKAVKIVRDLGRMGYKEPSRMERLIADFRISFPTVSIDAVQERMRSAVKLYKDVKGFKSVRIEKRKPPPSSADEAVFEAVLSPSYHDSSFHKDVTKTWTCYECRAVNDMSFKSCVECGIILPDAASAPYDDAMDMKLTSSSSAKSLTALAPIAAKARCCLTKICRNDDPSAIDDMFQLNCDHFFHLDCIAGYVRDFTERSRHAHNKVDYRCPECVEIGYGCPCWDCNLPGLSESDGCCYDDCSTGMMDLSTSMNMSMSVSMKAEPHVITYDEVKNLIRRCQENGDHLTLNNTHLDLMQRILLPAVEEGVLVITCRCGNLFEAHGHQSSGICPNCNLDMCFDCGEPRHDGRSCEEMNLISLEEALGVSQYCIGCDLLIEYESGCMHFTCSNCPEQFCFVCSAPHVPTLYHGQSYHRPKCELFQVCCDKKCLEGAAAACVEDRYLSGPCLACRSGGNYELHNRCEHSAWRACSFCVKEKKPCNHWCVACEKSGSLCSRPNNMRMLKGKEGEAKFNSLAEMAEAEKQTLGAAGKPKAASKADGDDEDNEEAMQTVRRERKHKSLGPRRRSKEVRAEYEERIAASRRNSFPAGILKNFAVPAGNADDAGDY